MKPLPLIILLLVMAAAPSLAVQPAELIDAKLDRSEIRFVGLSGGTLSYFDEDRRLQRAPAAGFVSLHLMKEADDEAARTPVAPSDVEKSSPEPGKKAGEAGDEKPPADPERNGPSGGFVELTDGHLIPGRFAGADAEGRLRWNSARFGRLTFDLERILRLRMTGPGGDDQKEAPEGGGGDPAPAGGDVVQLANGDAITGFIVTLQKSGLTVQVEGRELTLGWDRITAVRLANPRRPEPGVWARLTDGSRIRVERPDLDSETLTAKAFGDREITLPAADVRALDFERRHRLVRLGELPPPSVSGGEVFGVKMPPRIEGAAARLHAPVELTFHLPDRARRFAAEASLPPDALEWADLNLIVLSGGERLARHHLSREKPEARVNVALEEDTLTLRVEPAANGPIMDRLRLDHAALLVAVGE